MKTLKEQFKTLTGTDAPSSGAAPARKEKEKKPAAVVKEPKNEPTTTASSGGVKKQTKYIKSYQEIIEITVFFILDWVLNLKKKKILLIGMLK